GPHRHPRVAFCRSLEVPKSSAWFESDWARGTISYWKRSRLENGFLSLFCFTCVGAIGKASGGDSHAGGPTHLPIAGTDPVLCGTDPVLCSTTVIPSTRGDSTCCFVPSGQITVISSGRSALPRPIVTGSSDCDR